MKKTILKFSIVLIILAGIIFSCQKEFTELINNERGEDINFARSWYEMNFSSGLDLKSADISDGGVLAIPDWEHVSWQNHGNFTTVEMPLTGNPFGMVTSENWQAFKESGDNRYMASMTRLVILTEKKTQRTYSFFMTISPDKAYRESKNFSTFHSIYKKWQKDYSGLILYHNLDGSFSNGWLFENGKVVRSIKMKNGTEIDIELKSTQCITIYIQEWWQDCWYNILTEWGEYINFCDEPYSITLGEYTACWDDDLDGDDGYTPPPAQQQDPNMPCAGDPKKNPTIASSGESGTAGGMFGCVRIGSSPQCIYEQKKYHDGIDIAVPLNTNLYAMYGGIVIEARNEYTSEQTLGKRVIIKTQNAWGTYYMSYCHLNSVNVAVNDTVEVGDIIGLSGNTGNASGDGIIPHVHVMVYDASWNKINPIGYFTTTFDTEGYVIGGGCD